MEKTHGPHSAFLRNRYVKFYRLKVRQAFYNIPLQPSARKVLSAQYLERGYIYPYFFQCQCHCYATSYPATCSLQPFLCYMHMPHVKTNTPILKLSNTQVLFSVYRFRDLEVANACHILLLNLKLEKRISKSFLSSAKQIQSVKCPYSHLRTESSNICKQDFLKY